MSFVLRRFETSARTLGEELRERRKLLNFTLGEMSEKTKIRRRFLEAMEENRFHDLPPPLYARRLVELYAKALHFDPEVCRERFDELRGTSDFVGAARLPLQRVRLKQIWGSQRIATWVAIGFFFLALMGSLTYQVQRVSTPPELVITFPDDQSLVHSAVLELTGLTRPGAILRVNGEHILLSHDGSFTAPLLLEQGLNIITIDVRTRYSREHVTYHRLIFEPEH